MVVGFIGAGNMASALARGWGDAALFSDSGSGRAAKLADELGGEAVSNRECAERADLLILAHKPYQLDEVASEVAAEKIVVSILGGTTLAEVQARHPNAAVFRVEPNTPTEIRRGVTAMAASE